MAALSNQRMVRSARSGGVAFWALMASVAVHIIVLTAFGFVKFSPYRQQPEAKAQDRHRPVPTAKINRIKKLIDSALIIPKPKIKKPSNISTDRLTAEPASSSYAKAYLHSPPDGGTANLKYREPGLAKYSVPISRFSLPSGAISSPQIKFFGSSSRDRKVCYLVDCSGSMQGFFGQVRKNLAESIRDLQPDQYFYIIFFGGGKLYESGDGRLIRASRQAKSAAYDFIDSVRPGGQTNAIQAMEKAVQIRDGNAQSPSVIYFVTDGFELTERNIQTLPQKIANLLRRFAPATRINTIGFWPDNDDRRMLEVIAKQSGGEFVFVTDGDS